MVVNAVEVRDLHNSVLKRNKRSSFSIIRFKYPPFGTKLAAIEQIRANYAVIIPGFVHTC